VETTSVKLWRRDFTLLICGQIVSIFGNMVLSFTLPLYILDISGSATLFGLVGGVPYISLIIVTPIGGILADRLRKQRIMFWLDASTTVLIAAYMVMSGLIASVVPLVIVKLLALNAIQGVYIPAVQTSVPALVPLDKLTSGNAAVGVVNSLSAMAGMAIAGVLYGRYGLTPILVVSAICFAITAVMDLLIRIPFKKQSATGTLAQIVKSDISQSVRFATREKPALAKGAVVFFFLVMLLTSVLWVGLPVLITQYLYMGMEFVGINQSVMMIGGLAGGVVAGVVGMRLTLSKALAVLAAGSLFIIPMGLVVLIYTQPVMAYAIITAAGVLVFFTMQMFQIAAITFIQTETPSALVGKVLTVIMVLPFLAQALGQVIYGALFERLVALPWSIFFVTALLSAAIAMFSRGLFERVKKDHNIRNRNL